MLHRPPGIHEDELHALADDHLDSRRREAVLLFLQEVPDAKARVESWRAQNDALRAAFSRVGNEPIPLSLSLAAQMPADAPSFSVQNALPSASNFRQRLSMAFAFALGGLSILAITFLVDFMMHAGPISFGHEEGSPARQLSEWTAFLARAKTAYASSIPSEAGRTAAVPRHSVSGQGLFLPHLAADGLGSASVKILPGLSAPLACLVYSRAIKGSFALCAEHAGTGTVSPSAIATVQDENELKEGSTTILSWRQGSIRYALLGSLPTADLRRLADQARADIASFAD
ncbi:anti-sigma factor family protein [Beijerinckia mobilis]|uniref:anti-sigma factor family protein n=1 Tax=Beijerinckia mobilis TaxID=231434 RepID=UPI000690BFE4|nr:hypothetical protein [Beijerinckia mobilis]